MNKYIIIIIIIITTTTTPCHLSCFVSVTWSGSLPALKLRAQCTLLTLSWSTPPHAPLAASARGHPSEQYLFLFSKRKTPEQKPLDFLREKIFPMHLTFQRWSWFLTTAGTKHVPPRCTRRPPRSLVSYPRCFVRQPPGSTSTPWGSDSNSRSVFQLRK